MPKPTENAPAINASELLPGLPPKRARRRSTRASHSWRFRKPPSRKRVEATAARSLPQVFLAPRIGPMTEARQ